MPVFTTHKLLCEACGIITNMLEWDDKLPAKCRCGGNYSFAETKERVGVSQKEAMEEELNG